MASKHKGGKGKRAEYSTQVLRVPTNLVPVVTGVVEQFHQQRAIAVTGIALEELYRLSEIALLAEQGNAEDVRDEFIAIGSKVDALILSMDNTWSSFSCYPDDVHDAICQLVRFSLISAPVNYIPANAKEVANMMSGRRFDGSDDAAAFALMTGNYQVFAALYNPEPIERASYWKQYYTSQLGKTTGYWSWKKNPEAWDICPELTLLLDKLPKPDYYGINMVLSRLGEPVNPFYRRPLHKTYHADGGCSVGGCFDWGSLGGDDNRHEYLASFMDWLYTCNSLVGEDAMASILEVLFSCNRYRLEELKQVNLHGDSYWGEEVVVYEGLEECWTILGILKGS